MPRANQGPRLYWHEARGIWYIRWYEKGVKKVKSTGSAERRQAERTFKRFVDEMAVAICVKAEEKEREAKTYRRAATIYFIGAHLGAVKIGVTSDVHARLKSLQIGSPVKLEILATTVGTHKEEAEYHARFASYRMHGEWFAQLGPIADEIKRLQRRRK